MSQIIFGKGYYNGKRKWGWVLPTVATILIVIGLLWAFLYAQGIKI